jgi:uncharacterized membrane protein YsdA (DUF1294 family)
MLVITEILDFRYQILAIFIELPKIISLLQIRNIMSIYLIYFSAINLFGFFLIWYDKNKAIKNQYRISENTLLTIIAFGGFLGSGLAMLLFRHKTSKISYLLKFFGIIVVQIFIYYFILAIRF